MDKMEVEMVKLQVSSAAKYFLQNLSEYCFFTEFHVAVSHRYSVSLHLLVSSFKNQINLKFMRKESIFFGRFYLI